MDSFAGCQALWTHPLPSCWSDLDILYFESRIVKLNIFLREFNFSSLVVYSLLNKNQKSLYEHTGNNSRNRWFFFLEVKNI